MIIYILFGVLWTWFWDWFERSGIGDEDGEPHYMDNITRIVHVVLWPLFALLFIAGWIRGFITNINNNNDK